MIIYINVESVKSMNKVLCSTGAVIGRINDFNYKLLGEFVSKINCDGFEMMMEPFWNEEDTINGIISHLMPLKINFETMHMDKGIGELISKNEDGDIAEAVRIFDLNCQAASKLGIKLLVLHLWGGVPSDKHIDINIKVYADLLEISKKYNLILTVENIVCNTDNAVIHMKKLYETYGNRIKFTIDVRQAEFHKMLKETCEAGFLWENSLVPHMHIADFKGGYMDWSKLRPVLSPGDGDIDFEYLSDFLKKINYKGSFTLEAGPKTENGIDFEKLNRSLDFIYKNLAGN